MIDRGSLKGYPKIVSNDPASTFSIASCPHPSSNSDNRVIKVWNLKSRLLQ
jgi:hypothetical protein